jgi:hypothetical protein
VTIESAGVFIRGRIARADEPPLQGGVRVRGDNSARLHKPPSAPEMAEKVLF